MTEGAVWWLTLEAIGLASFPIAFAFFRFLPDRGYAFSKALGLLLVTYVLWLGATAHVIPNERWSIVLILVAMAAASAALAWRTRSEMADFVRDRWRYLLLVEGLFTVAFVTALWLRSFIAGGDLLTGEKPVEYAFINAISRAKYFPAEDPWFSGEPISYYYFGLLQIATLAKLTGVATQVAFNVALALTVALTATGAFGVVYNLVAAPLRRPQAVVFGLAGVVLLIFVGNLEGLFELLAVHDIGPQWLYDWIDIEGLNRGLASSKWYPSDEQFWWVRNRNLPTQWDIKEVPFWSFQHGDNSPHVMVVPFVLMATAAAFNLLRGRERLGTSWIRANPGSFALLALVTGSLSFLNSWSFPPALVLVIVVALVCNWWRSDGAVLAGVRDALVFSGLLILAAVLLFAPFYIDSRDAIWPLARIDVAGSNLPVASQVTLPKHLFIVWGPLLWLVAGLAAAALRRDLLRVRSLLAFAPGLVVVAYWGALVLIGGGASGFWNELEARGSSLITALLLLILLAGVVLAGSRFVLSRDEEMAESIVFVAAVVGVGLLLTLGTEFFFQDAPPFANSRLNTVFKLYHHAWVFLSLSAAFSLYYVLSHVRVERLPARLGRLSWLTVAGVLVAGALVFVPMVILSRTYELSTPRSLDSYRLSIQQFSPARYEALAWIDKNVKGTPVVLQAELGYYGEWGVSSFTGLPAVLGLAAHETQYRGSYEVVRVRQADVETAYKTPSEEEARALLEKYGVTYVYVGPYERARYGSEGLAKFASFMDVVYQNEDVTIYRVRE